MIAQQMGERRSLPTSDSTQVNPATPQPSLHQGRTSPMRAISPIPTSYDQSHIRYSTGQARVQPYVGAPWLNRPVSPQMASTQPPGSPVASPMAPVQGYSPYAVPNQYQVGYQSNRPPSNWQGPYQGYPTIQCWEPPSGGWGS